MGRDKALVPLAGKPLIQHVLDRVLGLGDDTLITTNRPQDYAHLGYRLVRDREPGAGALTGLYTALQAARHETVLVLACDMPFVSRTLLEHLLNRAAEADVVIPWRRGEYEPLHAVYRRACLPAIEAALASEDRRVISFFPRVLVLKVEGAELERLDPDGRSFFNVNTPQDLVEAERLIAEG
jgi:molybdopterin-guanine dinucleotide biosynthesis protein A